VPVLRHLGLSVSGLFGEIIVLVQGPISCWACPGSCASTMLSVTSSPVSLWLVRRFARLWHVLWRSE